MGEDAMDLQRKVQENLERQQKLFEQLAQKEAHTPAVQPPAAPQSEADKVFAALDVNGDGVISRDEWMKAYGQKATAVPSSVTPAPRPPVSLPPVSLGPPLPTVTPVHQPVHPPLPLGSALTPVPPSFSPSPMGIAPSANVDALIADCSRKDTVIQDLLSELQKLRTESQASAAVVAAVTQNEMAAAQESKRMVDMTQAQLREVSAANSEMANKMNAAEIEKSQASQRCAQLEAQLASTQGEKSQAEQALHEAVQAAAAKDAKGSESEATILKLMAELEKQRNELVTVVGERDGSAAARTAAEGRIAMMENQLRGMQSDMAKQAESSVQLSAMASELASLELAMRHALSGDTAALQGRAMRSGAVVGMPPVIAEALHKVYGVASEFGAEMHKAAAQINDIRAERDLHGTRANGADAAKAELHQELVEACRRLSEMHNRCTSLEVENATLVTHNRELDERLRGADGEIEARRRFVEEVAAQLLASDKKLAEMPETSTVSIPSSTFSAVSHEEMPKDPTWQAMQVVLSERVTGCIVAREALVRTAVDSTGKISNLEEALKGLQAKMKESMDKLEADSSGQLQRARQEAEQAQATATQEFETQLQKAKDELSAFQRASKHKEEQAADDAQAMQENHEREMTAMRKSIADVKAENQRNLERIASFDHCNAENARLIQAFEERTRELESAVDRMVPPAIHESLKRELDDVSIRLAHTGEEKDRAAAELESLLAVIRELRFRLQEADEGNKGLEKENMKLCWQQVEWKSELQVLQEAVRKRDLQIAENEAEAENRKAELMQVVARSKAAQNDLKALQELVETIEQQRQGDARSHARVVAEHQRRNEELQQREAALRAHLEQLDSQLQRSRHLGLSGNTHRAAAGVSAVADELSGRLKEMRTEEEKAAATPGVKWDQLS